MPKKSSRITKLWRSCLTIFLVLASWQALSMAFPDNSRLFPSPLSVGKALISLLKEGELTLDLFFSLFRACTGFVIGSILGIAGGLMTGRSAKFSQTFGLIMNILRPIPVIAIVPLVIVWIGLGESAKILIVSWGVFFPVWINTHIGSAAVNEKYIWAAKSLGARSNRIWFEIILPGTIPAIIAGMRTGISISFICLVAAEMAGASSGLGFRITISHLTFRIDQMLAAILVLGLLGAVCDIAFTEFCQKLFPWNVNKRKSN